MPEWLLPTLEVALTALKIAGVIGAFIGLSGESAHSPKGRRRRMWAYAFLAMAVGAELCDSVLKRIDSREQAVRFERLAHPLGTIRVTPLYVFNLSGEDLSAYRKRLDQLGDYVPPDPKTEPAADALLNPVLEMDVFLYQKPDGQPKVDREPDLSFTVHPPSSPLLGDRSGSTQKTQTGMTHERNYNYVHGEIHSQSGTISNSPDDRYSNGAIISSRDLLGSELKIRFCPVVILLGPGTGPEKDAALAQKINLDKVYIDFPGLPEFAISPSDTKNVRFAPASGREVCSVLSYTFPSTLEELEKVPPH